MKIKVGINWGRTISNELIIPLFVLWINKFYLPLSAYIVLIFYIYFYSILFIRIFYFYDEYYEVFFPTRIFHRRKRIFYDEIEKVTYLPGFKAGTFLMVAKYGHKGFYVRKYAIPCDSFKKVAKPLILFFRSKGIKIKFDCERRTTREYEEMLKD